MISIRGEGSFCRSKIGLRFEEASDIYWWMSWFDSDPGIPDECFLFHHVAVRAYYLWLILLQNDVHDAELIYFPVNYQYRGVAQAPFT